MGMLEDAKHPPAKSIAPSVKADLPSGDPFVFQRVFAVLSNVANHRHIS